MKFSVIIATRNRPLSLFRCIQSICDNAYPSYEIIIIDQSDQHISGKGNIPYHASQRGRIRHVISVQKGLSHGRNQGIRLAKGDICVFTDDDCIVSSDWLTKISEAFSAHPDVAGVFGSSHPYQPKKHPGYTCPCTFVRPVASVITAPCFHATDIGLGNNMAFKKSVFSAIGEYKTWLGVNAVGRSAEDAEFALRALLSRYHLLHEPSVKIFHNKWLTKEEQEKQQALYTFGELACYGYFYLQGCGFASPVIFSNIRQTVRGFLSLRLHDFAKGTFISRLRYQSVLGYSRIAGFCVAAWYAWRDPLEMNNRNFSRQAASR